MPDLTAIKDCCQAIVEKGKDLFSWEWDDHFQAVLSVISSEKQQEAQQILEACCDEVVDEQAHKDGPIEMRRILNQVGGLRSGQKAFLFGREQPEFIIVTWWPWGSGANISLRVRLMALGLRKDDAETALSSFKSWFGV
jgi:hypothetical protein